VITSQICFALADSAVDDLSFDPLFRAVVSEGFKALGWVRALILGIENIVGRCKKADVMTSRRVLRELQLHVHATIGHLTPRPLRPEGRKVVAIVCPGRPQESRQYLDSDSWIRLQVKRPDHSWGPSSLTSGISGSEEAVVHMTKQFVELGYWVEVYGSPGSQDVGEFSAAK
jgi:hypothetical protein